MERADGGGRTKSAVHVVRFLGGDAVERIGRVAKVEGGDVLIAPSDGAGAGPDGPAVAYFDLVGSVRGRLAWSDGVARFAMETIPAKRERVLRGIDAIAAMSPEARSEMRGNARVTPLVTAVEVETADGRVKGALVNMSRSGALLATDAVAAVGDAVTVGRTRGKVARVVQDGFAVAFFRLVPVDEFGPGYAP